MDNTRLTFLFHRYVNNSCTEAEKNEFLSFADDPRNEARLTALMDSLWAEVSARKMDAHRSERILRKILGKDAIPLPVSRRAAFPWLKVAASFLLVCGAGLFYYSSFEETGVTHERNLAIETPDARFIKLPDGSTVVVNAGSKLEYPGTFNGSIREVSLVGEAYFDITHDADRPFVVHTGKLTTTVLGTAFNIKAYPDQSDITVTVTRGKVKVSDDKKVLGIIRPDEQITFNTARELSEQKHVDSYAVASWIEKDIFFDDVTIADALEQLETRFAITIALTNEDIAGCRFTATFMKGENIEQILRILCDFNNATLVVRTTGDFVIEGGACPS